MIYWYGYIAVFFLICVIIGVILQLVDSTFGRLADLINRAVFGIKREKTHREIERMFDEEDKRTASPLEKIVEKTWGSKCPVCGKAVRENDKMIVCVRCKKAFHMACAIRRRACVKPGCNSPVLLLPEHKIRTWYDVTADDLD